MKSKSTQNGATPARRSLRRRRGIRNPF